MTILWPWLVYVHAFMTTSVINIYIYWWCRYISMIWIQYIFTCAFDWSTLLANLTQHKRQLTVTDVVFNQPTSMGFQWFTLQGRITYPTKREGRKIIDSKVPLKGGYASSQEDIQTWYWTKVFFFGGGECCGFVVQFERYVYFKVY